MPKIKQLHSVTASGILSAYVEDAAAKGKPVPKPVRDAIKAILPTVRDEDFLDGVWRSLNSQTEPDAYAYAKELFDREFFFYGSVANATKQRLAKELITYFSPKRPTLLWQKYLSGALTPPILDDDDEDGDE